MTRETITMLIILSALQIADAVTTATVLRLGGKEANPIIRAAMDLVGVVPALVIKGVVVVALAWHLPIDAIQGAVAIYVLIVLWNLRVIQKMRGGQ